MKMERTCPNITLAVGSEVNFDFALAEVGTLRVLWSHGSGCKPFILGGEDSVLKPHGIGKQLPTVSPKANIMELSQCER